MIKDIKIHKVEVCSQDMTVTQVAKLLKNSEERYIYVVDEEQRVKGVISPVDITNKSVAQEKDPNKLTAKDIMETNVKSVDINKEVEFAMKIMFENKIYSCPVTDNEKLVGVVDYASVTQKIAKKLSEN